MSLDRDQAGAAAERLRSYAQPQRLMILSYVLERESTVGEIDAATGIGQPALSQQLAELRRAGLVATRRLSKQVFYRLADDSVAHCVRAIGAMFGGAPEEAAAVRRVAAQKDLAQEEAQPAPKANSGAANSGAAMFARVTQP